MSDNSVPAETLISAAKRFELGFFTPGENQSRYGTKRYVGIWYYGLNPKTVVWVANRTSPIDERTGFFGVEDGNLKLMNDNKTYWSTDVDTSSGNLTLQLRDSGNLVLMDDESSDVKWESFKDPTDTLLPGMVMMDGNLKLISWKSRDDPNVGNFSFGLENESTDKYTILRNQQYPYWRSGFSDELPISNEVAAVIYLFSNFTKMAHKYANNANASLVNSPSRYENGRLVMSFKGEIQYWILDNKKKKMELNWFEPKDKCSVFDACGAFGSCNAVNSSLSCKCLPGFKPLSPENWQSKDFSDGCSRKLETCGHDDTFLSLKKIKVDDTSIQFEVQNETDCKKWCLGKCRSKCKAYSYKDINSLSHRNNKNSTIQCTIWNEDLRTIQEQYPDGRINLFVRVALSDIELTSRDCNTCGTNMVPYPLSTGPTCGDPLYFSFQCNSTGKLTFKTPSGVYLVTAVDSDTRRFSIEFDQTQSNKKVDNCNVRSNRVLQLKRPFRISEGINLCSSTIDIQWDPPLEPVCNSSLDCEDWPFSTCKLGMDKIKRCICNTNLWNGTTLNCTRESVNVPLKNSPLDVLPRRNIKMTIILGVTLPTAVVVSCSIILCVYMQKRKSKRLEIQRNRPHHMYGSERQVKQLIDSEAFKEEDKKGIDVPFYDLESIISATDNFSDVNKLGQGGYGPVYKGKFPGGQEIAIKRLSSVSGQGLQEFKNEVVLIAKLQHRNLVRLWGYCTEGSEKILIYEYMPNKSLDFFIFESRQPVILDWHTRFNIILGIARGLLYLHQDSRLRIIHRDLKTSNILLDAEMNAKISDFGLARIVSSKQIEDNTQRVVGTYGYMSPEYALEGVFSIKTDVFSFGVVLLETISGKRITRFYQSEQHASLLGYAWRLWTEQKIVELMDETLSETCNKDEFSKCACVALLCVQEDPNDRPTMSTVIFMLGSETTSLPTPKQPAFVLRRGFSSAASSSSKYEISTGQTTR